MKLFLFGSMVLVCVSVITAQSLFNGRNLFNNNRRGGANNNRLSLGKLFGNNRNTNRDSDRSRNRRPNLNRRRNNNGGSLFGNKFSDMFGARLLDESRNREAFREGTIFGDRGLAQKASNNEFRFRENDDERFELQENSEEYLEFNDENRNADKSYFAMNVVDENDSRSESRTAFSSGRKQDNGVLYEKDTDTDAENVEQSQSDVQTETQFETETQNENESESKIQAEEEAENISETLEE